MVNFIDNLGNLNETQMQHRRALKTLITHPDIGKEYGENFESNTTFSINVDTNVDFELVAQRGSMSRAATLRRTTL